MAVQISKKRKVRAASRLDAAAGDLHIAGVAPGATPGLAGAGWRGGDDGGCGRMAADGARQGTWRREAGVRERARESCAAPGAEGNHGFPPLGPFMGLAQGSGLVCRGEAGCGCAAGRGAVLEADELPCFFLSFF